MKKSALALLALPTLLAACGAASVSTTPKTSQPMPTTTTTVPAPRVLTIPAVATCVPGAPIVAFCTNETSVPLTVKSTSAHADSVMVTLATTSSSTWQSFQLLVHFNGVKPSVLKGPIAKIAGTGVSGTMMLSAQSSTFLPLMSAGWGDPYVAVNNARTEVDVTSNFGSASAGVVPGFGLDGGTMRMALTPTAVTFTPITVSTGQGNFPANRVLTSTAPIVCPLPSLPGGLKYQTVTFNGGVIFGVVGTKTTTLGALFPGIKR
ncbi:MAG: hypothetical protein ACYDHP_05525 [Ferrimicrobium sp.]